MVSSEVRGGEEGGEGGGRERAAMPVATMSTGRGEEGREGEREGGREGEGGREREGGKGREGGG